MAAVTLPCHMVHIQWAQGCRVFLPNAVAHFEPAGTSTPIERQADAVPLSTTGASLTSPVAAPEVLHQVSLKVRNAAKHVSQGPAMAASFMAASVEHAPGSSSLADRAQDSAGVGRQETAQEAADGAWL